MTDAREHRTYYTLSDRTEGVAELAAEVPELADWHNNYEGTLEAAGIGGTSLSIAGQRALREVASLPSVLAEGVQEIVAAARSVGFEEGFHDGLADALADDNEDDDLPS